jgi:hypothetical protein
MVAIEAAYLEVKTFDVADMTAAVLRTYVPAITFIQAAGAGSAAYLPRASASDSEVDYFGTSDTYALGTESASGRMFGVWVDHGMNGDTTYYIIGCAVRRW